MRSTSLLRHQALSFFVGLSRSTSSVLSCAHIFIEPLCAHHLHCVDGRTHQFITAAGLAHHLIAVYGPVHLICVICANLIFALLLLLAIYQAQVWLIHLQARINFCSRLIAISIGLNVTGSLPFQLGSLPWAHCHFNCLQCHGFFTISIGFIAMGSLPFQLPSVKWFLCCFNWLHCHGLIAISIGFNVMGSLPFQLASLPWAHCRFNWLQCHWFFAF